MKKSRIVLCCLLFFFGVFSLTSNSRAADSTAASCSQTDVQNAVTQCIGNADCTTVRIPAGTCTWTTNVSVATGISKDIRIIGAGQTSTYIVDFRLTIPAGGSNIIELAHLAIGGASLSGEIFNNKFRPAVNAGSKELNFHHLTISGRGPIGTIEGWLGVLHHNTFTCRSGQYGWYVHGYGNYDVADPPMGTRASLFFENNLFDGCYHSIAGFCNSKIVFRYNTVKYSTHCVDVHGPGYNYCYYSVDGNGDHLYEGGRLFEHYNNTYEASSACGAKLRSGSGISTANTYAFESNGWWSYFGLYDDHPDTGEHCYHKFTYPCTDGVCQGIQKYWIWNDASCPATVWSNSEIGIGCFNVSNNSAPGCIRENNEYFLREPNAGTDGFSWSAFTYPHPLIEGQPPETDTIAPSAPGNLMVK